MYARVCVGLYGGRREHVEAEEGIGPPGAGVQVVVSHMTWGLRTELVSSLRAIHASNP